MTTPIVLPNCDPTKHRPDGSHAILCFEGAVPGLAAARLGDCGEDHAELRIQAVAAFRAALLAAVEGVQWPRPHGDFYVDGFGDARAAVLDIIREETPR